MKLTEYSLRASRFTFVVFFCIAALGLSSYFEIPRREDPALNLPWTVAVVVLPGASAIEMERLIVRPLEDSIKELSNIRKLRAIIKDGVVVLTIEFMADVDPDKSYDDVLRQINKVRGTLPNGITTLDVKRLSTSNVALLQLALVSPDASVAQLDEIAEELRRRCESIPGVRATERHALPDRQVRIAIDLDRVASMRLPLTQIINALQGGSTTIPGGAVEMGARRFNLETSGAYRSLAEIRQTPVTGAGPAVVRVGDIAEVAWATESNDYFARLNGERAVFIMVMPGANANLFSVRDGVMAELARLRATLPANVRLEAVFDQTENIKRRLGQLEIDFLIAFALVLITVLPLGFRAALLVLISIPLSLAMGVAALHLLGHSLDQLSVVGFVIALGLLVDDSIVVVENIARFRRMGHPPVDAALAGTNQIAVAVIGTTAVVLLAFFPLLNLPGTSGQFLLPLPLAVVLTVLASMLVSLTIVPLLASWLLSGEGAAHENAWLRGLNRVLQSTYRPLLHVCMQHRGLTLLVAVGLTALAPLVVKQIGFSLFPKAGIPQFLIEIETEEGSSLAATDGVARQVETMLASNRAVAWYMTTVGSGNPQVYYNYVGARQKATAAAVFASLTQYDPKTSPLELDRLRRAFEKIPGARVTVREFENGPDKDADIAIRLTGENLEQMTALAGQVTDVIARHPGVESVINPLGSRRMDFKVVVDDSAAALLGTARVEIDRAVRLAFAGLNVGRMRDAGGKEFNVQLALARGDHATLEAWSKVLVPSASGAYVPIDRVARLDFISGPPIIERFNRERAALVRAEVRTGYNVGKVTDAIRDELAKLAWPPGVRWALSGEAESREESFSGVGAVLLVSAFGIFAILVLEFGSFRGTLIVASVVPLGLAGGVTALWIAGYSLSFTGAIGFIALIGMEIKNSILLVDFTNQLRAEGVPLAEAIERAGETRFLPIVLTTATAAGALLPLALQGSGLYSPLALVILGGLLSSLLLSRVVTPVVYSLLPPSIPTLPPAVKQ